MRKNALLSEKAKILDLLSILIYTFLFYQKILITKIILDLLFIKFGI